MKVPKRKATVMATDGPVYMADGGGVDDKIPAKKAKVQNTELEATLPESWTKRDSTLGNVHNLGLGEKPLTDEQLLYLGLSRWNGDAGNDQALQEGDNGWYKANPYVPPAGAKNAIDQTGLAPVLNTAPVLKYPKVGTDAWIENQANVQKLRQERESMLSGRAEGGPVGKGIRGYLAGGDITTNDEIKDPNYRKYKSGFGNTLADIGLGLVDLSLPFAPDLIKSEDYQTKAGTGAINETTHGIGTVGHGIATGVIDAIFPGVGTAGDALTGVVRKEGGEDKAIKQGQHETEDSIAGVGKIVGSLIGNKGKSAATSTNTSSEATGIQKIGQYAQTATDVINTAGAVQKAVNSKDQSVDYSTYDTSKFDNNQLSAWSSAKTNSDREALLKGWGYLAQGGPVNFKSAKVKKIDNAKAQGGQIKGKGTTKSDSIPALLDDGGFVVPAENAELAQQLREKYLGDFKSKKADLKSGDTKVKVSNGEHYFDAEEKAYLEQQGVDVNALAPNAKNTSQGKASGGGIDDDLINVAKKRIATQKVEDKKTAENKDIEALRDKNASQWSQNKVTRREQQNRLRDEIIEHEKELLDYQKRYKVYLKNISTPEGKKLLEKADRNHLTDSEYLNHFTELKGKIDQKLKEKMYWDNEKNFDSVTGTMVKKYSPATGDSDQTKKAAAALSSASPVKTANVQTGAGVAKRTTGSGNVVTKNGLLRKVNSESLSTFEPIQGTLDAKNYTGEVLSEKNQQEAVNSVEADTKPGKNGTSSSQSSKAENNGMNINPEQIFALTQAGLGLSQLLADGKRPVDELDPDFGKAVADANAEAQFGLSNQERSFAERGIERNRRTGIQDIINLSGGNSGTALANINAANVAADDQLGNLSIESENLRLNKKRYADALTTQKVGMKRQLFADKLNAFEQDQMAGANLLGSGIKNFIGSMRYDKQLEADAEAEKLSNPTFTI